VSIIRIEDNQVVCVCPICGCEFVYGNFSKAEMDDPMFGKLWHEILERQYCDECVEIQDNKAKIRGKKEREQEFLLRLPELIKEDNLPPNYLFEKGDVPCRHVANWIWTNKDRNVLLTGNTGTGKTTSAVACLYRLLKNYKRRVFYINFTELTVAYRIAKMSDTRKYVNPVSEFMQRMSALNVLCIDEICGKGKMTELGEELLYKIINGVADGTFRAKVWILGNLRGQTLPSMFNDFEMAKRRLATSFVCSCITDNAMIEPLDVRNEL
jgi:DNA replication protein DnaC